MNSQSSNRILIVDDEESILSAYRRNLYSFSKDYQIEYESNSRRALEKIKQSKYDVLLTDLNMPGIDGLTLLQEVKDDPQTSNMEVIVVTGLDDHQLKKVALESGATDLLTKPVSMEELIARLKNTLELKNARDDLLKQNKDLKNQLILTQKMELIGILAGGAVHDLNNILGVIMGYGQLIQFNEGLDDHVRRGLSSILTSVDRAAAITKQIHSFTRSGGQEDEKVVINYLLKDIKESLASSIAKHTIIRLEVPENEMFVLKSNPTYIYQIAMNLSINAVQAMDGKGELVIKVTSDDKNIILSFSDTGPGIDPEVQEKIFEPMFTTKKSTGGSGLGLSIVKQIIEDIGGEISLKSAVGEGTEFIVMLPTSG